MVFITMNKFKLHPTFLVVILFSILLGLLNEMFAILLAFLIHELGHLIFIKLSDRKVNGITLYPFGGIIDYQQTNDFLYKEILISLGGIILNYIFFKLFLICRLYLLANINYFLFVINLLTMYPLDGGRVMVYLLSFFLPYKLSKFICVTLSIVISCALLVFFTFNYNGYYLLIILLVFLKINFDNLRYLKKEYHQFILLKHLYPNTSFKEKLTKIWSNDPVGNLFYQRKMIYDYKEFVVKEEDVLTKFFKNKK